MYAVTLELLFKTYTDKPSRLGIVFKYPHQARIEYELLLGKGRGQRFDLKAELIKDQLQITVTSYQNGFSHTYKQVGFRHEQLRRLMNHIRQKQPLQFVHVYYDGNSPFIAKPFEKEQFITIDHAEVIIPDYDEIQKIPD